MGNAEGIFIKYKDIEKRMEETFMATMTELANDKYDNAKEIKLKKMIKKAIETSSHEAYVNVICSGLVEQIFELIKK